MLGRIAPLFLQGCIKFHFKSTTSALEMAAQMVENAKFSNARSENSLTRVCIFRIYLISPPVEGKLHQK